MRWDYAQAAREHAAINRESPVGGYMPMRKCAGECNRRRSVGQFAAGSTVCIRCARRALP